MLQETKKLLLALGITSNYDGYDYLVTAIKLVILYPDMLHALTKELYPAIAKEHKTTSMCVEKSLRLACKIAWEKGNKALLSKLMGTTVIEKPKNGQMIGILSEYIILHQDEFFTDVPKVNQNYL